MKRQVATVGQNSGRAGQRRLNDVITTISVGAKRRMTVAGLLASAGAFGPATYIIASPFPPLSSPTHLRHERAERRADVASAGAAAVAGLDLFCSREGSLHASTSGRRVRTLNRTHSLPAWLRLHLPATAGSKYHRALPHPRATPTTRYLSRLLYLNCRSPCDVYAFMYRYTAPTTSVLFSTFCLLTAFYPPLLSYRRAYAKSASCLTSTGGSFYQTPPLGADINVDGIILERRGNVDFAAIVAGRQTHVLMRANRDALAINMFVAACLPSPALPPMPSSCYLLRLPLPPSHNINASPRVVTFSVRTYHALLRLAAARRASRDGP